MKDQFFYCLVCLINAKQTFYHCSYFKDDVALDFIDFVIFVFYIFFLLPLVDRLPAVLWVAKTCTSAHAFPGLILTCDPVGYVCLSCTPFLVKQGLSVLC